MAGLVRSRGCRRRSVRATAVEIEGAMGWQDGCPGGGRSQSRSALSWSHSSPASPPAAMARASIVPDACTSSESSFWLKALRGRVFVASASMYNFGDYQPSEHSPPACRHEIEQCKPHRGPGQIKRAEALLMKNGGASSRRGRHQVLQRGRDLAHLGCAPRPC